MRFEQTEDVLYHARAFHLVLNRYYHSAAKRSKSTKLKLMLEYLAKNEHKLAIAIADYQDQAPPSVLQAWFQYTDDANVLILPDFVKSDATKSIENLTELANKLGDELIELYLEMANHVNAESIKEVFNNLAQMQRQEQRKLSMNVDRLIDL